MVKKKTLTHQQKKERLLSLIDLSGLTFLGFEDLLDYKSEGKYIHQIKNDTKDVSTLMIKRIENAFGFDEGEFSNLTKNFDKEKIKNRISLFKEDNPENLDFFQLEDVVLSVIKILIKEGFLKYKKSGVEILRKFNELGYNYSSEFLSGKLVNLVKTGFLKAEKRKIILKNGELGRKLVNYYWAEPKS